MASRERMGRGINVTLRERYDLAIRLLADIDDQGLPDAIRPIIEEHIDLLLATDERFARTLEDALAVRRDREALTPVADIRAPRRRRGTADPRER